MRFLICDHIFMTIQSAPLAVKMPAHSVSASLILWSISVSRLGAGVVVESPVMRLLLFRQASDTPRHRNLSKSERRRSAYDKSCTSTLMGLRGQRVSALVSNRVVTAPDCVSVWESVPHVSLPPSHRKVLLPRNVLWLQDTRHPLG